MRTLTGLEKLFVLLIAAGLIAAGFVLSRRAAIEAANRQVEIAVDLSEFTELAAAAGRSIDDVLAELRAAGATSAGVEEMTLERMHRLGLATRMRGADLVGLARAGAVADPELAAALRAEALRPDAAYLIFDDPERAEWFEAAAARRMPPGTWHAVRAGSRRLVGLVLPDGEWDKRGFGIWPGDVQRVTRAGLYVVPKLQNYPGPDDQSFSPDVGAVAAAGGRISTVVFAGGQALGYPNRLSAAAAALTTAGAVQGLVEAPVQLGFIRQLGQDELARLGGYRAARVYSIHPRELEKLTPQEVLDRWPRAVRERNIRLIYVRPMRVLPADEPMLPANLQLVRAAAQRLRADGWTLGPARPFPPTRPPAWAAIAIAVAILAAAAWVGALALPLPPWLVFLGLAAGAAAAGYALAFGRGELTRKALSLLAALAFPSLALTWAGWRASLRGARAPASRRAAAAVGARDPRRRAARLTDSAWELAPSVRFGAALAIGAALISLAGGLLLAALLADNRYLLEIEYFRGVKLSLTMPMAAGAWLIARHWGVAATGRWDARGRNVLREVERVARAELRAWHLAALAFVAVGAYIYLGRSGHTAGIEVPGAEVQFRDWLEAVLVARPRTKEFLVGYPALMGAAWALHRGWTGLVIPAILAGGVALTSLVNSFEHMRTEFLLSLWRAGNGLALGLIVGAIGIAVLDRLLALYLRWREHA